MKIFFIRHGETDYNSKKILQGQLDTDLNNIGVLQSIKIANKISDIKIDKIYSSDLKRAISTAKIILEENSVKESNLVIDSRLKERSYGKLEGMNSDEVISKFNFLKANNEEDYCNRFGVETNEKFKKRIFSFLDELTKKEYNTVLVISHGLTSLLFKEYFYGGTFLWEGKNILGNCELLEFSYKEK